MPLSLPPRSPRDLRPLAGPDGTGQDPAAQGDLIRAIGQVREIASITTYTALILLNPVSPTFLGARRTGVSMASTTSRSWNCRCFRRKTRQISRPISTAAHSASSRLAGRPGLHPMIPQRSAYRAHAASCPAGRWVPTKVLWRLRGRGGSRDGSTGRRVGAGEPFGDQNSMGLLGGGDPRGVMRRPTGGFLEAAGEYGHRVGERS